MSTKNDDHAAEFAEAGVQALIASLGSLLDDGLRTSDVLAALAGDDHLSLSTFRRAFRDREAFVAAVIDALPPRYSVDAVHAAIIAQLAVRPDRPAAAVRALVTRHFATLATMSTRQLLAHLFLGADRVRRLGLQDEYDQRDVLVRGAFTAAFDHVGAVLRRPLNKRTFPIVVNALVDGLLLRHRIDPNAVPAALLGDALLALLGACVDVEQAYVPLDDAVAALLDERDAGRAIRPPNLRADVVRAARTMFARPEGFFHTGLAEIASEAGVSPATLTAVFPSREHIVVAALEPQVTRLRIAIADDLRLEPDTVTIVRDHLGRLAQLIRDERTYIEALIAAVVQTTYGHPAGMDAIKDELDLPSILEPVIDRGQTERVFTRDEEPAAIAAALTNAVLLHGFTNPGVEPTASARLIANTTLRGILVDPRQLSAPSGARPPTPHATNRR